jgi:hypothetical protein
VKRRNLIPGDEVQASLCQGREGPAIPLTVYEGDPEASKEPLVVGN